MRSVDVTKREFDLFLYPSFMNGGAKDEGELEIAFRIRRTFRSVASPEVIPPEQDKAIRARGGKPLAAYELNDEAAEISLEEDEYNLLKDRLLAYIPGISMGLADEFYEFIQKFKAAPSVEVRTLKAEN